MNLLECLMTLRPDERAEGAQVGVVNSTGETFTITFGKVTPVEPEPDQFLIQYNQASAAVNQPPSSVS